MPDFPSGYCFHPLARVKSTNMHAMESLSAGLAVNGDVFFTNFQSEGKGQRGKSWLSEPGDSVLMSIVLDTNRLTPSQSFRLSAAISLAVKDFLQIFTSEEINIKWPNDIYTGDRKAGGILIENVVNNGLLKWSVVGIGINVNQISFPEHLPKAISLRMLTGKTYDAETLAKQLTGFINLRWQQLLSGGWSEIIAAYNQALYGKGMIIKLRKGAVIIPCKIKRVNNHGLLIAGENDEWHFAHGDVEWLFD